MTDSDKQPAEHIPEEADQALHTLAEVSVEVAEGPGELQEFLKHGNEKLSEDGARFKLVPADAEEPTPSSELTDEERAARREEIRAFYRLSPEERRRLRIRHHLAQTARRGVDDSDDKPAV